MEKVNPLNNNHIVSNPKQPLLSNPLVLVFLIVTASVLSSFATYFVVSTNQNTQSQMPYQQNATVLPTQAVVSTPTQRTTTKSFVKRQFDINKKIEISGGNFIDYPKELLSIGENDLVAMECSPYIWYSYNSDSYLYYEENIPAEKIITKDTKTLTDKKLLKLINEANKNVPSKTIDDIRFCDTEDSRTVFQYGTHAGGGGNQNVANFGIVNSDGTVKKITAIPNDGAPYFECRWPLQLTKSGLLYYECGGGDGFFGATSFYKINLTANTHSAVLKCTSVGNDRGEPVKITCK